MRARVFVGVLVRVLVCVFVCVLACVRIEGLKRERILAQEPADTRNMSAYSSMNNSTHNDMQYSSQPRYDNGMQGDVAKLQVSAALSVRVCLCRCRCPRHHPPSPTDPVPRALSVV
jgi:hypothetical protein